MSTDELAGSIHELFCGCDHASCHVLTARMAREINELIEKERQRTIKELQMKLDRYLESE